MEPGTYWLKVRFFKHWTAQPPELLRRGDRGSGQKPHRQTCWPYPGVLSECSSIPISFHSMACDGSHATPHLPDGFSSQVSSCSTPCPQLSCPLTSLCALFISSFYPVLKAAFFLLSDALMSSVNKGLLLGKHITQVHFCPVHVQAVEIPRVGDRLGGNAVTTSGLIW